MEDKIGKLIPDKHISESAQAGVSVAAICPITFHAVLLSIMSPVKLRLEREADNQIILKAQLYSITSGV